MKEYHKIHSIYMRDRQTGKFLEGEYSRPEFEYLKNNVWIFDEKIDGTNIRIGFDGQRVGFGGRTDAAQIPATLYAVLTELFPVEKMKDAFPEIDGSDPTYQVVLYGEGYGAKIQKGGDRYLPDGQSFILFDVRIGRYWLQRAAVEEVAEDLGVTVTPIVGKGTLAEAITLCRYGFPSQLRSTPPEGIVLRPEVPLIARNGERIITKLKLKDFQ